MSLRRRLHALERALAIRPEVECSRCDDTSGQWIGVRVLDEGDRVPICPECGGGMDGHGRPVGPPGGRSEIKIIVLHRGSIPEAEAGEAGSG